MPGLHSLKMSCISNTKFPFKTMYLLGTRGLIISSYIVYDYIISGCNRSLGRERGGCVQYIYIFIQCTYISVHHVFLMQ